MGAPRIPNRTRGANLQLTESKRYSVEVGKGAPIRWIENKMLGRYLHGRGIEIGALWKKFPVGPQAQVWYVDRELPGRLHEQYPEIGPDVIAPDIVADAASLPFADATLDFIIASHVLEHLQFPLTVLRNWYRILAPGGALCLKVPDKRFTFDAKRKRTPLQHLVAEESDHTSFDKRSHYKDWIENVMGQTPGTEETEREIDRLAATDYSIHFHAWADADIREIIDHTRTTMHLNWQLKLFLPARFYRKECAAVLVKSQRDR